MDSNVELSWVWECFLFFGNYKCGWIGVGWLIY